MKKLLLGLLALCFLGGCSTKEESKDVTYDWTPPFEDVTWSMGEDEVLEELDLDEVDAQRKQNNDKQTVLSFATAIETEVGLASPDFIFEPGFGLVGVTLRYIPTEEEAVETLAKLEEAYGKSDDGKWLGTKFDDLGLSEKQITAFKKEDEGISEDDSIVTILLNQNHLTSNYQECVFEGKAAAILEHVLQKNN
ncbi:TPA: hypothetical protein QFP65_002483 [Enterococcus faecium]|uniref:hypothetical protein n=2 Tax=Enterococcus faecium TaxID=1352 RepID=UPI001A0AE780|nr:hypothetical protein [Enterococcus faecium]EMF0610069.1 hypothetical protein [Enterococcus faecium]MBZ3650201.1 hypothetical protein [Enterococcus faecium]MCD4909399.1 hypothetical protein [Enterococcus faecium]